MLKAIFGKTAAALILASLLDVLIGESTAPLLTCTSGKCKYCRCPWFCCSGRMMIASQQD